ncbi:SMI1/KNR4 family protein [Nodosilinea sp. FACHB-13]|uniref:SMI1/KNR4 family protein n=1 Tax=Cyanophyceae TaxID=3028117 RepID=UPI0016857BDD|nr:SMI1/KNR4 family protein [Nodosilinea sp. FACHB-13]MBD2107992.1 SMI1/KNR4 family protein [Nodosilinea sp. FACHB-13]
MDANVMQDLWNRLEAWLTINAPALLETLQSGATEEQIIQTEAFLSIQFPDDFKAAYRIHNGQVDYADGFIDAREFLSLERIQDEWKVWKDLLDSGDFNDYKSDPRGPVKDDWWNAKWIPITHDGSGNHDCLDLNPAKGGCVGQIIDFWHDEATREVKADNFDLWFAAFVEGCETGKYVYSDEYDGIVNAQDA